MVSDVELCPGGACLPTSLENNWNWRVHQNTKKKVEVDFFLFIRNLTIYIYNNLTKILTFPFK